MSKMQHKQPQEQYLALMERIRLRFDIISELRSQTKDTYTRAETTAFHCRKILEAVAFCCLIVTQNGIKAIPRDAINQWNAEKIFLSLKRKGINIVLKSGQIGAPTTEEKNTLKIKAVITLAEEKSLNFDQLIAIYKRLHKFTHEINPYLTVNINKSIQNDQCILWEDISTLRQLLERHFIEISGQAFYCVLWDENDAQTKVISLSQVTKNSSNKNKPLMKGIKREQPH